jgi:predicted DNA-binding transcriptional regulator AlpA
LSEELLTHREAAERARISPSTLHELVRVGDGPPRIRLGAGTVRYRASAVDEWVDEHTEAPRTPAP